MSARRASVGLAFAPLIFALAANAQFGSLTKALNKAKKAADSVQKQAPHSGQQTAAPTQPPAQQQPAAQQSAPAPAAGAQPQSAGQPAAAGSVAANAHPAAGSAQASSAFPPASLGDSVELTQQMWTLMTLRDLPQFMGDKYILPFVSAQISREQSAWANLMNLPGPGGGPATPRPQITYEWQKLIDEQPDLAGGPLLDVLVSNSPSWSFLDNNPKWDPNAQPGMLPIVEVFTFSKDKIEGRQADFAAHELLPVAKKQLQMAMKKLPTHFYFTEQLPQWKYDFDSKGIQFLTPNGPANTTELLFPLVNNLQGKGKEAAPYAIGGIAVTQLPEEKYPGGTPAYNWSAEWGWKNSLSAADVPMPVVAAFDRQTRISGVALDNAKAEALTKLGGLLSARLFYTADHIELENPAASPLSRTTRTVLFARLERIQILDRNGGLVATLDAQGFPAAKQANATAAAGNPSDPQAKKNADCRRMAENMSGTTNSANATYNSVFKECMARP